MAGVRAHFRERARETIQVRAHSRALSLVCLDTARAFLFALKVAAAYTKGALGALMAVPRPCPLPLR